MGTLVMTTSPIRRIALVGLGALGIMYGDFFAEKLGTENVVFLADETRCRRYGTARVTCNGRTDHFRFMTPETYRTACGEADLLFFCVKGTALTAAINEVRPVIVPDTVIVSVLNGITSEDVIEDAHTAGTVVHSVAQAMDALRQGTAVTYSRIGELRIGITEASPRKTAALVRLEDFFNRTDFAYQTETDILRRMWCKWMLNVGVNQTVAACAGTFKDVRHQPDGRRFERICRHHRHLESRRHALHAAGHACAPPDRSGTLCGHSDPQSADIGNCRPRQRSALPRNHGAARRLKTNLRDKTVDNVFRRGFSAAKAVSPTFVREYASLQAARPSFPLFQW